MNSVQVPQPPHSPYGMNPTPSPGQIAMPHNLPSINNLINPPQTDGMDRSVNCRNCSGIVPLTSPLGAGHHATPQAQNQQPAQATEVSESRVTKGKYSLGDFEILRTLGTGSFGRVHLVQSRHNQRFYAVKVLKKAQVVKMKQVEHTNDERKMLGEVKHPFLIMLWGTFQDSRNLYMVMDFVEGGELFSLLRKSGVGDPPKLPLKLSFARPPETDWPDSGSPTPSPSSMRRR
jgi:protein kinase A